MTAMPFRCEECGRNGGGTSDPVGRSARNQTYPHVTAVASLRRPLRGLLSVVLTELGRDCVRVIENRVTCSQI